MNYTKEMFDTAIGLWSEWNSRINVISRKDIENLYEHHILHSLAVGEFLASTGRSLSGSTVLDLGCGGGFPGIPLAMTNPDAQFTLCDSIGKKITVAKALADGLGLANVSCVNARAESLPGPYDWVVSRAVTSLENFYPWVKGKFVRSILYLKGGDVNQEISDLLRKNRGLKPGAVTVWPVSQWLQDSYYEGKYVIEIRNI